MTDDLDRITQEAAALDVGAGAIPGLDAPAVNAGAPAGPTQAEQIAMWAAIPATVGAILGMALPELRQVYTQEACNAWGAAMLPVAKKYGWDSLDNLPEFALLLASLPFAVATFTAIKRRRAPGEGGAPAGAAVAGKSEGASVNAGVV